MGMIYIGKVYVNLTIGLKCGRFFIRTSESLDSSTDIVSMECPRISLLAAVYRSFGLNRVERGLRV
jgi:hypothetical protein